MNKEKELLSRFGSNLAESMGAGRKSSSTVPQAPSGPTRHDGCTRLRAAAEIEVGRIIPDPNQPRTEFEAEAITRLAESMKTHGQLTPISVRWSEAASKYLIVTGERRWRAAVEAGKPTIEAIIVEGERTESQILEMQLIENCLREDLKPVEQARAFRALMDRNGWPALRLAEVLHLNCGTITRALSLLDLPASVQEKVEEGVLAPATAYEISKVADSAHQQALAELVVEGGLTRSETAKAVKASAKGKGRGAKTKARKLASRVFRAAAGYRVTVECGRGVEAHAIAAALAEALATIQDEIDQTEGRDAA